MNLATYLTDTPHPITHGRMVINDGQINDVCPPTMETDMQTVILEARSHKGKNRLANVRALLPHKSCVEWDLLTTEPKVIFSSKPGPWLHVMPRGVKAEDALHHSRWVHLIDDADFRVYAP